MSGNRIMGVPRVTGGISTQEQWRGGGVTANLNCLSFAWLIV